MTQDATILTNAKRWQ